MWGTEKAGAGDEQLHPRLASIRQQSWQLTEPSATGVGGLLNSSHFLLYIQTHRHLSLLLSHVKHPPSFSSMILFPSCTLTPIKLLLGHPIEMIRTAPEAQDYAWDMSHQLT